jgi:phytanoyl-CoA hydroxylase
MLTRQYSEESTADESVKHTDVTTLAKTFADDGIVQIKSILSENLVHKATDWLNDIIKMGSKIPKGFEPEFEAEQHDNQIAVRKLRRLYWNDPLFWKELITRAQIDTIAKSLVGNPVSLVFHAAFLKPSHVGSSVVLHQDQALWSYEYSKAVSIWIALSQVDEENGGLMGCLASHQRGLIQHTKIPGHSWHAGIDWREQKLPEPNVYKLQPGDALAWDRYYVHGSGENNSGRDRRAFVLVFVDRTAPNFLSKDRADF